MQPLAVCKCFVTIFRAYYLSTYQKSLHFPSKAASTSILLHRNNNLLPCGMPCLGTFQESEAHQVISGTKDQKCITKLIKEHKQVHKDRETQIQKYKITQIHRTGGQERHWMISGTNGARHDCKHTKTEKHEYKSTKLCRFFRKYNCSM